MNPDRVPKPTFLRVGRKIYDIKFFLEKEKKKTLRKQCAMALCC